MLRRLVFLMLSLAIPFHASASGYVVRPGDTLTAIAQRYHVAIATLARVNGIANLDLIQAGRVLTIPQTVSTFYYRVRWGDTLSDIAARYGLSVSAVRSLNPNLGQYLLAGKWLKLCHPCSGGYAGSGPPYSGSLPSTYTPSSGSGSHVVQPGETLTAIAVRYGVSLSSLQAANRLSNPDQIVIGSRLAIPARWAIPYNPYQARSLIISYAQHYGVAPSLALAIGWQESGFNENMVSSTRAVGVMQVEPYTGAHIAQLLGRPFNLYNIDDNIHAGVYWLSNLLGYYGGNERLAVAAYYQGTRAIATHGFYQDTVQYVNDVLALKARFGG